MISSNMCSKLNQNCYLLLMGVDEVFQSDFKLFKPASEISALLFDFSHLDTGLLGFLLKRFEFLLCHIVQILLVETHWTVDQC